MNSFISLTNYSGQQQWANQTWNKHCITVTREINQVLTLKLSVFLFNQPRYLFTNLADII